MGSLKTGVGIIYESPDGGDTVYGRYEGTNERFLVGYSFSKQASLDQQKEDKLWHDIRRAASNNEELQYALDRVKIIYELSRKDYGQE